MNTQDIANFAENLLGNKVDEAKQTGQAPLPATDMTGGGPDAPDISHVRVTNDFQNRILSESFNIASTEDSYLVEEAEYKKQLIESYEQKLFELEELIAEMSTVGMISSGGAGGPPMGGSPKENPTTSRPRRRRRGGRSARNFRTNR